MLDVYLGSSALPPAAFSAWLQTCEELAKAVAGGPRLIALVGAEGSGKTFTLKAVAASLPRQRARVRATGDPLAAGITVDLLDGLGPDAVRQLAAEPAFEGVRVVAVRPEAVGHLLQRNTDTRLVHMRTMSDRDVRQMVRSRQELHRLPQDAFAPGALAALNRFCDGNPARLDRLIEGAIKGRTGPKIGATDIERAERGLSTASPLPSAGKPGGTTDHRAEAASAWDLLNTPIHPGVLARTERRARRRALRRHALAAAAGVAVAAAVTWGVTTLPQIVEQAAEAAGNKLARYLDDIDRRTAPVLSATRSGGPGQPGTRSDP